MITHRPLSDNDSYKKWVLEQDMKDLHRAYKEFTFSLIAGGITCLLIVGMAIYSFIN